MKGRNKNKRERTTKKEMNKSKEKEMKIGRKENVSHKYWSAKVIINCKVVISFKTLSTRS